MWLTFSQKKKKCAGADKIIRVRRRVRMTIITKTFHLAELAMRGRIRRGVVPAEEPGWFGIVDVQ